MLGKLYNQTKGNFLSNYPELYHILTHNHMSSGFLTAEIDRKTKDNQEAMLAL